MKVKLNWFKRFSQWLSKKLEEHYSRRYYSNIEEIPIWNWWKIHETKDLKYLLKEKKKLTNHAVYIFDNLHSEFIRIFGVSESYKAYLDKIREIEILKIDMALSKDSFLQTMIDVANLELDELKVNQGESSYLKGAIALEKFMGFKLNPKELSVYEYYSYINELENSVDNGRK